MIILNKINADSIKSAKTIFNKNAKKRNGINNLKLLKKSLIDIFNISIKDMLIVAKIHKA